jgi:adenylate kinase-like protein
MMRYVCPKCGETYAVKPAEGTCRICDAALVAGSESREAEPPGEQRGMPSPKRRL